MKNFHRQAVSLLWLKFYLITTHFQNERGWLNALALFLFMISLSFYGNFRLSKIFFTKFARKFSLIFFCTARVKSFQSSRLFQIVLQNKHYWNAFVNPKKLTCEISDTQKIRNKNVRLKNDAQLDPCTQCPDFSTTSQGNLKYHIAKKNNAPKPIVTFKCKVCYQVFPGFYALRQHKNTQHGFRIKSANVDPDVIINEVDDANLKEELCSCQYFIVDSELERARHNVFNYAIENLNTKIMDEKHDHYLHNLKWAAKVNLAFGFILKNIENGGFR